MSQELTPRQIEIMAAATKQDATILAGEYSIVEKREIVEELVAEAKRDAEIEEARNLAENGLHRCPDGVVRASHPSFDCPVCEGMQSAAWYAEEGR